MPFPGLNGKPRHWIEIAPFVWYDQNGHDRLAAKVVDGKPVRFSFDLLSPFMVFDRVPWYAASGWLMPLFLASLGALLLTVLLWPVTAIVRRRYRAPLALEPAAFKAYRYSKIAALLILAGLALWGLIFMLILKDTGNLSSHLDPLIWLAQLFGVVAFFGGLALIVLNLRAVWRGKRRWPAKTWSIVLTVAAFMVLWVALVSKLLSFGTNY